MPGVGATADSSDPDRQAGPYTRWVQSAIEDPSKVYRAMFYVTMVFFLVTTLFPFYWLFVLAVTPFDKLSDVGLVPNGALLTTAGGIHTEWNFAAFFELFDRLPFHIYMLNSLIMALATTAFVLLIASLVGYVFGRLEFPGRRPLMLVVLAISYFPPAAFLLPLFRLFNGNVTLGFFGVSVSSPVLFNTPWAMMMPYTALFMPLSIFILTTFYSQIPDGLEDAARVEGTTRLGALFRVIIPLSAPGVATAAVLTFISVYNEFFFSFIMNDGAVPNAMVRQGKFLLLTKANHWAPLLKGILGYQTQYKQLFNLMAAASIVGVLPVAIIVVVAQEKIVSGLTAGALKE